MRETENILAPQAGRAGQTISRSSRTVALPRRFLVFQKEHFQ